AALTKVGGPASPPGCRPLLAEVSRETCGVVGWYGCFGAWNRCRAGGRKALHDRRRQGRQEDFQRMAPLYGIMSALPWAGRGRELLCTLFGRLGQEHDAG